MRFYSQGLTLLRHNSYACLYKWWSQNTSFIQTICAETWQRAKKQQIIVLFTTYNFCWYPRNFRHFLDRVYFKTLLFSISQCFGMRFKRLDCIDNDTIEFIILCFWNQWVWVSTLIYIKSQAKTHWSHCINDFVLQWKI